MFVVALIFVTPLTATGALLGDDDPPGQNAPPAEKKAAPAEDPLKVHRDRFTQADPNAEAALALSAGELIKAGDQVWLRDRLVSEETSETAALSILTAFLYNQDISALPEILILSARKDRPEVTARCRQVLTDFLGTEKTRGPMINTLLDICRSETTEIVLRLPAMQTLGLTADLAAVDVLIPFTGHADSNLRDAAVNALRNITYQTFGPDLKAWKTWWDAHRHFTRDRIIEPVLLGRLATREGEVHELRERMVQLAYQLIAADPVKAHPFLAWRDVRVRRRAAEVISGKENRERARGVIDEVTAHLAKGEEDEAVLIPLIRLLGSTGEEKPAIRDVLLTYLKDDARDGVKAAAARSLQTYKDPEVGQAVRSLLKSLAGEKSRDELKGALMNLLASAGNAGDLDLVVPFLALSNPKNLRTSAVKALGVLDGDRAITMLGRILDGTTDPEQDPATHAGVRFDPEYEVRFEVTGSLKRLGMAGTPENGLKAKVAEAFKIGLKDRDHRIRGACITGLSELKPADSLVIFREHLRTEESLEVRGWCIAAVGKLRKVEGLAVISHALPRTGMENGTGGGLDEKARIAVDTICGKELASWIQAIEVFFKDGHFALTTGFCDTYGQLAKGKNGEDTNARHIEIIRAESCLALYRIKAKWSMALESVKRLLELVPGEIRYRRAHAHILVCSGQHDAGFLAYTELLKAIPVDPPERYWDIRVELSELELERGKSPIRANADREVSRG